ncbi:MAG: alpha/beta hydrolase [Bdellovibrionales bacterium]|nr:alpha/beta hydrolase [Bdellovibrionales bacterium]
MISRLKPSKPILRSANWISSKALAQIGFEWDQHYVDEHPESGLGVWRLKTSKSRSRKKARGPVASSTRPGRKTERLVFVPGFGDSSLTWFPVFSLLSPLLSRKFDEIILVDYPGWHGFLHDEACFSSLEKLFKASAKTLDRLEPTVLMGHSLGGWVCAAYAVKKSKQARPSGVSRNYMGPEKLILAAPAGLYRSNQEIHQWKENFRDAIEGGFEQMRSRMFAKEPFLFRFISQEFKGFFTRPDVLQLLRSFDAKKLMLKGQAHSIAVPTWILWGDADQVNPFRWHRVWLDEMGQKLRVVQIPKTGHSLQVESPAVVAAVLAQILFDKVPHRFGSLFWKVKGGNHAQGASVLTNS